VGKIRMGQNGSSATSAGLAHVLVMSQHEAVRRQLVAYLNRSSSLDATGDELSIGAIARIRPDVLVLDLSQIGQEGLRQALDASRQVGARVIALASLRDAADERDVTAAGGIYRLKRAGADGLADVVSEAALQVRSGETPAL
jgi:DNA-binding NarL/FixJ family response regulator